jgi:hypothetical protein
MTRKEFQEITVKVLKSQIEKCGADRTYIESPNAKGRCRWTLAEALVAAEKDEDLPESNGINPVTDMVTFIGYCNERGRDWKDIFYSE